MKILITGAAGMIGRKLAARLAVDGHLGGRHLDALILADVVASQSLPGARVELCDVAEPGAAARLVAGRPDVIFHAAGVVSGEAENDLEKGYRVNLDGSRMLLDAIRLEGQGNGYRPRFVFTSSIAVFGPPFPEKIPDNFILAPLTSYGTAKAMTELMLSDYTRRGFVDGVGLRLPTICIRPGRPNKAASGFFSSILREPLAGQEAVLPVSQDVRAWHASPRAAVDFLLHAGTLDSEAIGVRRNLNMPGLSATVGEQIAALRRAAGERAVRLIRHEPDPAIMRMVDSWPRAFDPARALGLGFRADASFDEIIRAHMDDDLATPAACS